MGMEMDNTLPLIYPNSFWGRKKSWQAYQKIMFGVFKDHENTLLI